MKKITAVYDATLATVTVTWIEDPDQIEVTLVATMPDQEACVVQIQNWIDATWASFSGRSARHHIFTDERWGQVYGWMAKIADFIGPVTSMEIDGLSRQDTGADVTGHVFF